MSARPYTSGLPLTIARPHEGRSPGNVAAPETNVRPREATCRKELFIS